MESVTIFDVELDPTLIAHLHDLARQCERAQLPRASFFLSSSEVEALFQGQTSGSMEEVSYRVYGGNEDAERCIVIFLPSYLEEMDIEGVASENEFISLLHFKPKNASFADGFSHRDVLGALMNKGIKRETIGDIYIEGSEAYVYLTKAALHEGLSIDRIRSTSVTSRKLPLDECPIAIKKESFSITVSSIRLDLIVGASFHYSRETAQKLIEAKKVHMGYQENPGNDSKPKPGEKIYVEGKGKIRYIGEEGTSKKGKIVLKLERYL